MKLQKEKILKILHVDDDPDSIVIVRKKLSSCFDVVALRTPLEALELLKNSNFDIIITDYNMPGLNGIEFIKKIKSMLPEIPIVIYTAQENAELEKKAFKHGVAGYIIKSTIMQSDKKSFALKIKEIIKNEKNKKPA